MNDVKVDSNDIEEMYIKYYTPLKRYCMKLVSYNSRYTVIAEDCVQEAFYRAVCHAEDFSSSQNQYGWLAACCSHYMLSYIRKAKRREEIIGKPVSLEVYGDVPDLMDNVLAWIAHNAVAYAKAHSSNVNTDASDNKVPDPKRNTSFREGATGACANFVHQCLLAGGARMFDGWCYKLTGVPSSWDSASWTYTNKGRRRLLEKKWIERIPSTSVKAGDIIYSYYSDYASRNMNTPFNHVTIAITDYDSSTQGCNVCGHTLNQNNKFKKLSDTGIPCTYCYRVKTSLGGDGTEKAIDLTNGNSHAI